MAQNLTIAGASYSDVPAVNIAKTGGGIATFTDVSDSTVTPETLLEGETAYNAAGELITGTGSLGAVRYDTAQTLTAEQKTQARTNMGAEASGAVNTHNSASDAHSGLFANKENKPSNVSLSGAVTLTVSDNTIYSMTGVTSLALTGAVVECHGFVTFGSSAPSVTVSGFTASGGDDITSAAAGQVWEFSVFPHNSGSYIIWKNWSA